MEKNFVFCKLIFVAPAVFVCIAITPQCKRSHSAYDDPDFIKAYACMSRGNADSAKPYIDKALGNRYISDSGTGWYLKGFIYKELYKKHDSIKKQSAYRDTAVACFFRSIMLDSTETNKKDCTASIKFLAASYYNDAASLMDTLHYRTAADYYWKYRMAIKRIEPSTDLKHLDMAFYLKLGEVYSYYTFHAGSYKRETKFMDSAEKVYLSALAIDSNNISANYNLGVLYYNYGVYIIKRRDYVDNKKANMVQDSAAYFMKKSEPFMNKASRLTLKNDPSIEEKKE